MKISTFIALIIGFVLMLMLIVVEPSGPIEYRTFNNVNYYQTLKKGVYKNSDGKKLIIENFGGSMYVEDPYNPDFNLLYISSLEIHIKTSEGQTFICNFEGTCTRGQISVDGLYEQQLSVFKANYIPIEDQNLISPSYRVLLVTFFYSISVLFYKVAALNGFDQYKLIERVKGKKPNDIDDQKMYSRRFHKWFKISLYVLSFSSFVFLFKFIYWIK